MASDTIMVLKGWDERLRAYKYAYLTDQHAVAAVDDWLTRNLKRMPPPHELGAVMPEREVIVARDGDLDSPETHTVPIIGEMDSTGRRAITREEIAALDDIFEKRGNPGLPPKKSPQTPVT